jgi:flagellar motor switch protein FliG
MNVPSSAIIGLRKAAILVISLDRAAADLLLEQMNPKQAQAVRQAVMDLGPVDPKEKREILAEFQRRTPRGPATSAPGVELDPGLAKKIASPAAGVPARAPAQRVSGQPFQLLREAEVEKLVRILLPERPQTIALVLSHMPPAQAGNVLARLHPGLQTDVIRRLVDLEETDPEILAEVERGLESRLSEQVRMQRRRVAGLSAVTGILEACSQPVGMQILDNLSSQDQQLAEKLSPEQFEFGDLLEFDDATLGVTLRAAEMELIVLALVGAPPEWTERFLGLATEAQARQVRRELEHLGPMRLSDVEEARQRLAELARRLAMQGRIRLPRKATMAIAA